MRKLMTLLAVAATVLAMSMQTSAQTWVQAGSFASTGGATIEFGSLPPTPENIVSAVVSMAKVDLLPQFQAQLFAAMPPQLGGQEITFSADKNGVTVLKAGTSVGTALWTFDFGTPRYHTFLKGNEAILKSFAYTPLDNMGKQYRLTFDVVLKSDGNVYYLGSQEPLPYPYSGLFRIEGQLTGTRNNTMVELDLVNQGDYAKLYFEAIPDAPTMTLFASGLLPLVALWRRRKA